LVWLKDVRTIEPVRIHKKDWRAWVVLTEKENFGLLKHAAMRKLGTCVFSCIFAAFS